MTDAPGDRSAGKTWFRRVVHLVKRLIQTAVAVVALLGLVILLGLIPVNNDFQPDEDGIEIFIVSNPVHADIIVPMRTDVIDWSQSFPASCFRGDWPNATHIAFGWGDQGFFIETPTWADLRMSTAMKALFWSSDSCLHVWLAEEDLLPEGSRSVRISTEQYRDLVDFINATYEADQDGKPAQIADAAYHDYDAFFEAHGTYHCLNTCNCWAGRAMRTAGIRTGWLTPLPKSIFLYLPE